MVLSFDLFGTLVEVERPADPADAVAAELEARGVAVPDDWGAAYREPHVDAPPGAEVPLPAHVAAALRSRGVDVDPGANGGNVVRRATIAAFDPSVGTIGGARAAVDAARERGPVGILSNCSVPGLARRALARSALAADGFDAVVTSAGCGWRKPDRRAFAAVAERLGAPLDDLVHVGDDPGTDGGAADAGARYLPVEDGGLDDLAGRL